MMVDLPKNVREQVLRELNAGDFVAAKSIHDEFMSNKHYHKPAQMRDPKSKRHKLTPEE